MTRIDKWLWCVRVFKTRSLATEACKKGKIKIDGVQVKASKEVKSNEIYTVHREGIVYTYKVLGILDKRVSAKLAPEFVIDLTSAEELEKIKVKKEARVAYNEFGLGRPSKKDRREIAKFLDIDDEEE